MEAVVRVTGERALEAAGDRVDYVGGADGGCGVRAGGEDDECAVGGHADYESGN